VIEDKVEFMLTVSQVTLQVNSPLAAAPQVVKMTLKDFYLEMQRQGGMVVNKGFDKELAGGDGTAQESGAATESGLEPIDAEFSVASDTAKQDSSTVSDQGSNERPAVVSADDPCV